MISTAATSSPFGSDVFMGFGDSSAYVLTDEFAAYPSRGLRSSHIVLCRGSAMTMESVLGRYWSYSRRRRRKAAAKHQRLDIQGLRMVAVLTVFADHLWGWPTGGFVGVDVFFVISGFLITGNLLRGAEATGTVSFRGFYWNRIRRIMPAATVVLVLTCLAAMLVYLPFRANQVAVDSFFAFVFFANWHFAIQGTDYFTADDAVSPIQHYWSLSIEEQFYFVWPALIFVISVLVLRKAWTHEHRMRIAGYVMAAIVILSFGWANYETSTSPTWAYFDTFSRVWELGVGALLATAVGTLARIPSWLKPVLSWGGLGLIATSIFMLNEGINGFPAPWALVPVTGAAMVIAAGVGEEPKYQAFLCNPVSGYIGDISYSLYLVHWPVIVMLGALMNPGPSYYSIVVALAVGLAIASYHGVENPLRHIDGDKIRDLKNRRKLRQYGLGKPSQYAMAGSMTLLAIALVVYAVARPDLDQQALPPSVIEAANTPDDDTASSKTVGPLATALHNEIVDAAKATAWPRLDPSMESVIDGPLVAPDIGDCGQTFFPDMDACTWGDPSAPINIVMLGDSVAISYVEPLREIANNSGGQIRVHNEAAFGCSYSEDLIVSAEKRIEAACPSRKDHAADVINEIKPNIVIISNSYLEKELASPGAGVLTPDQWGDSLRRYIDRFRGSVEKIVLLAPPPAVPNISDCYGKRTNMPAKCINQVSGQWLSMAKAEQQLAQSLGATWVDARPWFCSNRRVCPSFVGSTPTMRDTSHMASAYGVKISPVIAESFQRLGIIP